MRTWYVKKLSKLTNISVRTLHYYDKINLLKPSARGPNGYRLYSEDDLLNLEQIIALKFFGFTLAQIRMIIQSKADTLKLLRSQLNLIQEEISYLENAQRKLLTSTISELESKKNVDWHGIVELIEAYAQANELKRQQTTEFFENQS